MAKLTRTMTGTAYPKKWTYSTWIKRSGVAEDYIFYATDGGGTNKTHVTFSAAGNFRIYNTISSSTSNNLITNRVFRDPGAWYHIVIIWDTANGTPGDRIRLYVNGVRETSFSTETLNDENGTINTAVEHQISGYATSSYIDGVMAHTHFCDNQTYDASYFGETDATSGIWIAKTSPSVTYGDNGFFLKYASGAHGTDSSGESNDFTTSGTLTNTKDTPDNNFATFNPLDNYYAGSTFSQGNNTVVTGSSPRYAPSEATMGLVSGKWYWETKCTVGASDSWIHGICSSLDTGESNYLGENTNDYGYFANGQYYTGGSGASYGDSYTVDDIIGNYLDLDNNKMYCAKNGTVQNSGTGISITAPASTVKGAYFPAFGDWSSAQTFTYHLNFGNGYFGTTAVTSGVADAGGEGTFEYDPSSGTFDGSSKDFRAICTNNIATYG